MSTSKAGWSEIDTTPPLGLPMGGRGPRFSPGASILDPLISQALLLEDKSGARILWISVDLVSMDQTAVHRLRLDLATVTGVPFESIIVNVSHTHSGPMCGFEGYSTLTPKPAELQAYENALHQKILRVGVEALETLQPVQISVRRGESAVGISRRRPSDTGDMAMGPNPDGACNPDLWLLDISASEGDGRAVVFNYGCHPVLVYGFAWDGISSDFPGVCRRDLRDRLGPNVHAQFIQGLAGNVRPRIVADLDAGRFRTSTEDDPKGAGRELADNITDLLGTDGEAIELDLRAAAGWFLAPKDPSRIPPLEHWQSLSVDGAADPLRSGSRSSEDELAQNLADYWTCRLMSGIPPAKAVSIGIGLMQIAEGHRIAWISGEVLAEWMGHLRNWMDDPKLMVWGYCQDGRGYLPTDEILHEGGYEVDRSNNYSKTGPGRFAKGVNDSAHRSFSALARQIDS